MGVNCNYKGENNYINWVSDITLRFNVVPVCPEQLGGLSTPRLSAEIIDADGRSLWDKGKGQVMNIEGKDLTCAFIKGANEINKIVGLLGIKYAILKNKSPSCGVFNIYDGSFSNKVVKGMGVTAAALKKANVSIFSHDDKDKFFNFFY